MSAINQAIAQDRLPGAVLLVGHNGQIVYRKAYGSVRWFAAGGHDPRYHLRLRLLTKVIATTPSLMKLFEQGSSG